MKRYPQIENILAAEATQETRYRYGLCGVYALALHDLSKGKLKLKMIYGTRPDDVYEDEEAEVNIHSYVETPEGIALDVEGKIDPQALADEWEAEGADRTALDLSYGTREKFIKELDATGSSHTDAEYKAALAHAKQNKKLKPYLI